MAKKNKLTKSNDRVLSGVLGGISDYLDLDTTLVRLLFVAAAVFTGFFPFVFLYIIAAVIMPETKIMIVMNTVLMRKQTVNDVM